MLAIYPPVGEKKKVTKVYFFTVLYLFCEIRFDDIGDKETLNSPIPEKCREHFMNTLFRRPNV
jgi:hypothetical protein